MRILKRPLNPGEIFACSMQKVKEKFHDTSVVLNFAYYSRNYGTFSNTPDFYYVQKNIKGTVICSMYMYSKQKEPIISFYVLKRDMYSNELQSEFSEKFLDLFYDLYLSLYQDNDMQRNCFLLVELDNGKLKKHIVQY